MTLWNVLRRCLPGGGGIVRGMQGFAVAAVWLQAATSARLAVGTGPGSTLVLTAAVLAGFGIGWRVACRVGTEPWSRRIAALAATIAALLTGWWAGMVGAGLSRIPLEVVSQTPIEFAARLAMVLPMLGVCSAAVAGVLSRVRDPIGPAVRGISPAGIIGFAASMVTAPTLLLPGIASATASLIALAVVLAGILYEEIFEGHPGSESASDDFAAPPTWGPEFPWLLSLVVGGAFAVVVSMLTQLVPRTYATEYAIPGGLLLGWGLSLTRAFRQVAWTPARMVSLALLPGALVAGLLMTSSGMAGLSLRISAYLSHVLLIGAGRHAVLLLGAVPFGFILGRGLIDDARRPGVRFSPVWGAAFGFFAVQSLPFTPVAAACLAIVASLVLGGWMSRPLFRSEESVQRSPFRWSPAFPGALAAVAVVALCSTGLYRPDRSEKLLYSGGIFAAFRGGVPVSQLPMLDDGRLVATAETLWSRRSAWSYRGTQLLVRHDGISSEYRSTNPRLAPNSAADVVPAVFGLTMGSSADHVLVLGWHAPSVETCLGFPVQSLTVIESDPQVSRLNGLLGPRGALPSSHGDERLRLVSADPELAILARHPRRYDFILNSLSQSVTVAGVAPRTAEYFAAVRRHLSDDGLFCQRLPYYDLGPAVVARIVATFRESFPQMVLTESVPGELLLIGGASAAPLVTTGMIDRLKAPQARAVLAASGLDWSALIGRGGLDSAAVEKLVADEKRRCRLASPDFAFNVAREMMTWGDKAQSGRQRLAKHGRSLSAYLGNVPETQEIDERLEDFRTARQVQDLHPDQPWGYRAVLKQRLKDRPRTAIVQVKGEGLRHGLHPEDQRRKDYLIDLAHVSTQERPPVEEIRELTRYAEPFDPLLTLFVHYETARLLGRLENVPPRSHFEELVHTVYYSADGDQSVRNICAAIEILCRRPESASGPAERWDQLNGLLDILAARWQARLADGRKRKYDQVDADHTLKAAELAFQTMHTLRPDIPVAVEDWEIRREVLKVRLTLPVAAHRGRLLKQVVLTP